MSEKAVNGPKIDEVQAAVTFLENTLERMGLRAEVDARIEKKFLRVRIQGEDAETLIVGQGSAAKSDVLDALQLLASRAIYPGEGGRTVVIDANDFRDSRLELLAPAADRLADLALVSKQTVRVYGMNSFDRRAIHLRLAERTDVVTSSDGDGVYRTINVASRSGAPAEGEGEGEGEESA